MKLIFKKDEDDNITVQIVTGTSTTDFSYVGMIKELVKSNEIEESVFEGNITEEEKEKLKLMLAKVSSAISENKSEAE